MSLTGVKSYFGEQLVEFGFPVGAIKRIEEKNSKLITFNAETTKNYVVSNPQQILSVLVEYEKKLMNNALKSIL